MSEFAKGTLWLSDCNELEKYVVKILELQDRIRELEAALAFQKDLLAKYHAQNCAPQTETGAEQK